MAIASDVDETSTGRSGNPVENEERNMLADSSGLNQIDCTVHHYYEKLKDFAFDMPGGWTDATISLFIDTFKFYKDDFSRPHPDELKIWQKIVKRCVERSNNHKVFTVNSVMELAGSLKSHVLRNEYRKDDETFKMLYNDVVDIIPYFPNTTCDSVSQNLRLRSRTHEAKAFASATDITSKTANVDNLIIKYCEEMNLRFERYCCNSNWNKISKEILENHGIRIDVKKYLGDMKRKLAKDLKGEIDPVKKSTAFYEKIGAFKPYFDLMPPRTIKIEDFDKDFELNDFDDGSAEVSSDDQTEISDTQKNETASDGPRVYRRATPKKLRPGNSSLDSFPRIRKILGITENSCSSESDDSHKRHRSAMKKSSRNQHEDSSCESITSPDTSDDIDTDAGNAESVKQQSPKKRNSVDSQTSSSKPQFKGRTRKLTPSSDDESSPTRNNRALKRPMSESACNSKMTTRKNMVFGSHNSKNPRLNERDKSSLPAINTDQNHIFKTHAKIELSPLKVRGSAMSDLSSQSGKKSDKMGQTDACYDTRNKRVNFSIKPDSAHPAMVESNSGHPDGDSQHDARSGIPNSMERIKSKNIVTPINVKVSDQVRQEASTSTAGSEQFTRTEKAVQHRSSNSVSQDFNRLERMEENTVRLIEGYKEKVKDAGHSVMQLIPKQHIAIPPVGVSNNANNDNEYIVQPLSLGKPPGWFDAFITDYKKHEMWKMHQLLKMQQELVDMENRKLNVLEKILTSLTNKKS